MLSSEILIQALGLITAVINLFLVVPQVRQGKGRLGLILTLPILFGLFGWWVRDIFPDRCARMLIVQRNSPPTRIGDGYEIELETTPDLRSGDIMRYCGSNWRAVITKATTRAGIGPQDRDRVIHDMEAFGDKAWVEFLRAYAKVGEVKRDTLRELSIAKLQVRKFGVSLQDLSERCYMRGDVLAIDALRFEMFHIFDTLGSTSGDPDAVILMLMSAPSSPDTP